MKKTLLTLFFAIFLTGCVGYIATDNQMKEFKQGEFSLGVRGFVIGHMAEEISQEKLIQAWGEPDLKYREGGYEYWRYDKDKYIWSGVVAVVIIPIPLMVPTGTDHAIFKVHDTNILSVSENRNFGKTVLCGLFLMDVDPPIKFDCISE